MTKTCNTKPSSLKRLVLVMSITTKIETMHSEDDTLKMSRPQKVNIDDIPNYYDI